MDRETILTSPIYLALILLGMIVAVLLIALVLGVE